MAAEINPAPQGADGHRARLKARFLEGAGVGLADHELLELALTYAIPRKDVKPLAKALLQRFGNLGGVLTASQAELTSVAGIGEGAATLVKLIASLSKRIAAQGLESKPLLDNRVALLDYLYTRFADAQREEVVALFVDARFHLLATETLFTGTLDASTASPREIIKRALDHNAAGLIIAHNHPSGRPEPSPDDVALTTALAATCAALGITLFDHLIIGRESHYSFKGAGLL